MPMMARKMRWFMTPRSRGAVRCTAGGGTPGRSNSSTPRLVGDTKADLRQGDACLSGFWRESPCAPMQSYIGVPKLVGDIKAHVRHGNRAVIRVQPHKPLAPGADRCNSPTPMQSLMDSPTSASSSHGSAGWL